MTTHPSVQEQFDERAEELLLGKSHPVLAIVSFAGAFLFAAIPFLLSSDHVAVVSVCMIGCATAAILFIRLLVGKLGMFKYGMLLPPAILCIVAYVAGQEWYLVVIITLGTIVCSYLLARVLGDFMPIVRGVSL